MRRRCGARIGFPAVLLALMLVLGPAGLPPAAAQDTSSDGKALYNARCAGCHGAKGDGRGPAAERLQPPPRDFTKGQYRYHSTESGKLPTDADLTHVIAQGFHGTTMPGWQSELEQSEIAALVSYLKTFSRRFERGAPGPLAIGAAPAMTAESIARGQELFECQLECVKCHGLAGRGDGPSAQTLETSDTKQPIRPANLTRPWTYKAGARPEDIFRTLWGGFSGTPMPSVASALTPEQTWDVVSYVRSLHTHPDLVAGEPPETDGVLLARRVATLPGGVDDPAWNDVEADYFPLVGQISDAPRQYTPSITFVLAQAVHDGEAIAVRLVWDDRTLSPTDHDKQSATADRPAGPDQMAVQIPQVLEPAGSAKKPRFLAGDKRRAVNLWQWTSDGDQVGEAIGHGLNAIQLQPQEGQQLQGEHVYGHGQHRLVLRRPLATTDDADLALPVGTFIPLGFHAWDGSNGDQGSQHAVSTWYNLYLEPAAGPRRLTGVPLAVALTVAVEGLAVWWARRRRPRV